MDQVYLLERGEKISQFMVK